jgi:hypothetical protein
MCQMMLIGISTIMMVWSLFMRIIGVGAKYSTL